MFKKLLKKLNGLVIRKKVQMEGVAVFSAEKEQTNTLVGIIYILAIAAAVGALFLLAFPEIGDTVVDSIKGFFTSLGV